MTPTHVDIGLGIAIPVRVAFDGSTRAGDVTIEAELRSGKYVASRVIVVTDSSAGVTGAALRDLAISDLIRQHAADGTIADRISTLASEILPPKGRTLTRDVLRLTTVAYRYGYAVSKKPTAEAHRLLGVSRATASRWVAAARAEGLLGETVMRKAHV